MITLRPKQIVALLAGVCLAASVAFAQQGSTVRLAARPAYQRALKKQS